ncbi:DnaJ domain-containing protein, partial [bacterium]|nr:DnaJ domain-containing protein [bacterium]
MADNVKKDETSIETNLYRILEVTPIATFDEIHKSYRQLSKKYHPDLCE